jgi:hypothetical protein
MAESCDGGDGPTSGQTLSVVDVLRCAAARDWLLESSEPAIRVLVKRELLDAVCDDEVRSGALMRGLLGGENPDEILLEHPYTKWSGAHWRLVSLVELGVPVDEPTLGAMIEHVLAWLTPDGRTAPGGLIGGRWRRHASIEGNAVAVCSRLGLAGDERVQAMVDALLEWQWPDGGWNCDRHPEAMHSSYHETLSAAWGLHEFAAATGDAAAAEAARRAGELLLQRRVFRRHRDGEPVHHSWVTLHYPAYWHYDILQALVVLSRLGLVDDDRAADALDVIEARQLPDGRWRAGGAWWRRPGSDNYPEAVDWGRSGPNEMITLNALRALRASGRLRDGGHSLRLK